MRSSSLFFRDASIILTCSDVIFSILDYSQSNNIFNQINLRAGFKENQQNLNSFPGAPPQNVSTNQKPKPIKVDKKIGRNDKVTITKGSETKVLKYKKALQLLDDGWTLS